VNLDRFQPWASLGAAVAGVGLAVGSAYAAVELATTTLTLASYVGSAVGYGVYGLVNAHATHRIATGDHDTTGTREGDSLAGVTGVPFFCLLGANVLLWVPNVDPPWRPLFFVPAAFIVLLGLAGIVVSNRHVRGWFGWATLDASD
jgi:putative flippase GtrA